MQRGKWTKVVEPSSFLAINRIVSPRCFQVILFTASSVICAVRNFIVPGAMSMGAYAADA
jgi:hypothetical protein